MKWLKQIGHWGGEHLLVFMIAFGWTLVSEIGEIIASAVGVSEAQIDTRRFAPLWLYSEAIGIIVMVWYYRFRNRAYLVPFKRQRAGADYCWGALIGLGSFTVIWLLIWMAGGYHVISVFRLARLPELVLLIGGFVVQSMFEELLCRGYVMGYWLQQNKVVTAFVANSLLFMFLHTANPGFDWRAGLGIFLFGLFMSFLRYRSGSLWLSGAVHAAWNIAEGVVFGTAVSGTADVSVLWHSTPLAVSQWLTGGTFGVERSLPTLIVLGGLCGYLGWRQWRDCLGNKAGA
ncbi:MAG: CPBP family intramembrane metalloprotease [Lactobacillus sp.]|jgi:membrane protease YdiL (CAAX protease family)|nr:CPBP family intramembrane metalloprotease [Lactobacillus sp.]MCI2033589.1 CPBP family intramembrane metalloprotease [Lactobacillus sp.]